MRRSILPVKDFRTYHRLVRRLRALRPDVVHTHSSKAGIVGRWAADRAKVPVVVHTIHGLAFTASTSRVVNHVYKALERQAAPLTDRIVCVADAMRDQSLAGRVGRADQYVTVYSGMNTRPFVDPPVPRTELRRRLGIADHHVVAGTIARLFHLKGHDDLLTLAPDLCRRLPDLRFCGSATGCSASRSSGGSPGWACGTGSCSPAWSRPERVPELTAAMDVLVHPSRREGLARALPQGQLAGCPVVTYDVDGNREGLADGRTGHLIRPFDVAALGEAVARLAADADARRAMGEAGPGVRAGPVRHSGDGRRARAGVPRRVGAEPTRGGVDRVARGPFTARVRGWNRAAIGCGLWFLPPTPGAVPADSSARRMHPGAQPPAWGEQRPLTPASTLCPLPSAYYPRMSRFLVFGPHPDDQELGMGGTIAKLVKQGHYVHLIDMTNGEPTPHGSVEVRARESAAAAAALGVERSLVGLKNREVQHTVEARHRVAAVIRQHRPDVLFVPYPVDAHPDHVAVTRICEDARFDAKLTKSTIPGDPWHPKRIIYYYCTHLRMNLTRRSASTSPTRSMPRPPRSPATRRSSTTSRP
jgi:LmbE family N-acetylglucosaminyl deacetylase/glycosyltransferase involved in cell wall biosynthesis